MRGLYICSFDPNNNTNSYYQDWAENFKKNGFHIFNTFINPTYELKGLFNPFYYDLIIYGFSSLPNLSLRYQKFLRSITKFSKATTIGFMQNEVKDLREKIKFFESLNVNIITSQYDQEMAQELYKGRINAKIISIPHAMSTLNKIDSICHKKRFIDIGGRLRPFPHYLGNYQRSEIIPEVVKKLKKIENLKVDFSIKENRRLGYTDWMNFLKNCRMSLSCESGSFFLQWTDSLRKKFIENEKKNLNFTFTQFFKKYLKGSNSYFKAAVISSRQFDAISCGSCNLLIKGKYSKLLKANIHYLEINEDLSNLNEVIDMASDYRFTEKISRNALKYSLQHHTIKKRINKILKNL